MREDDDNDEQEQQGDKYVIGQWHAYYGVALHCLIGKDGKPRIDYWTATEMSSWYRWNSYHAAKKFQRAHDRLRGYVIVNLSKLLRQAKEQRESDERWVHRDK